MMTNPGNVPDPILFLFGILWSVAGYFLYYFMGRSHLHFHRIPLIASRYHFSVAHVVIQRSWGLLLLGLVPLGLSITLFRLEPSDVGLGFRFDAPPPLFYFLLLPLIILLSYYHAPRTSNLNRYPQIRVNDWSAGLLILSSVTWILYLMAYEFLFRGLLFHTSLEVMGHLPAIALNCIIYAIAHLGKGATEVLGAIPLGILLCYLTLVTGNIWGAVVIHSVMALSNEWFSIRAHPDMSLKKG